MPWFIRYAALKSEWEDVLHYTNDFAFDNNRLTAAMKKNLNQLSNTILSHIYKTVLIHFKWCYWTLLIDLNTEKTVQNKYDTEIIKSSWRSQILILVPHRNLFSILQDKNVFLQFKL